VRKGKQKRRKSKRKKQRELRRGTFLGLREVVEGGWKDGGQKEPGKGTREGERGPLNLPTRSLAHESSQREKAPVTKKKRGGEGVQQRGGLVRKKNGKKEQTIISKPVELENSLSKV